MTPADRKFYELHAESRGGFFALDSTTVKDERGEVVAEIRSHWFSPPSIRLEGKTYQIQNRTRKLKRIPILPSDELRESIVMEDDRVVLLAESSQSLLASATKVVIDGRSFELSGVPTNAQWELSENGELVATVPWRGILTKHFPVRYREDLPIIVPLYICCLSESAG